MKNLLLLFATLILLIGCSRVSDEDLRKAHTAYENGALIVDVRTVEEFKSRHIQNAINIPVQKLDKLYSSLPKDREIIVYCRSGSRSSMAAGYLRKKGRVVYDVATQGDWERELPSELPKE